MVTKTITPRLCWTGLGLQPTIVKKDVLPNAEMQVAVALKNISGLCLEEHRVDLRSGRSFNTCHTPHRRCDSPCRWEFLSPSWTQRHHRLSDTCTDL